MHRISHPSVRGACCLDIGFRHMFSAFDCVVFWLVYTPCGQVFTVRFADASPGVGSLVGGEFSQSLGTRLLVSALRAVGAPCNLVSICLYIHVVLTII